MKSYTDFFRLISAISLMIWQLSLSIFGSELPCSASENSTRKIRRSIDFNSEVSLGSLDLVPLYPLTLSVHIKDRKLLTAAKGKVLVEVPSGYLLCFEPNRRLLDHPELMQNITPDAIDILFINASSMDDAENQRCDKAMDFASHFTSMKQLFVDRSDVTDLGLMKLGKLRSLQSISTMLCDVNGSCFKALAKLPALQSLSLWGTHISEKYFGDLALLPHLNNLNLNQVKLTPVAMQGISRCQSLKTLGLAYDAKFDNTMASYLVPLKNLETLDLRKTSIDDQALPTLAKMKSLKSLDLRGTRITPAGLLALKPLHLRTLIISDRSYSPIQLKDIHSVCANATIMPSDRVKTIDHDTIRTFAPVTRHGSY